MGLYHLVFLVVFSVYGPLLLWQMIRYPNYRRGVLERMGRVRRTESGKPVVWIHGVSVGEVKVASTLLEALREEYPDWEVVLSSTTPTGHSLARELHPDRGQGIIVAKVQVPPNGGQPREAVEVC